MQKTSKTLLLASLATALALPTLGLAEGQSQDKDAGKVPCWGINKCKATGDCGAGGCRQTGCHGSNACKGQGFIRLEQDVCLRIEGGRLTKSVEKTSAKPEKKTEKK